MEQLMSFLPVLNSHPPVRIEHKQIQISVKRRRKKQSQKVFKVKSKNNFVKASELQTKPRNSGKRKVFCAKNGISVFPQSVPFVSSSTTWGAALKIVCKQQWCWSQWRQHWQEQEAGLAGSNRPNGSQQWPLPKQFSAGKWQMGWQQTEKLNK